MILKRKDLEMFEDELELKLKNKRNWYGIIWGTEAVASGALLACDSVFAAACMLMMIPTALLAKRRAKKVNFRYTTEIAKQAKASEDLMNRLSYEDFEYILRLDKFFKDTNLDVEEIKEFTASMKKNSLHYLRQDISYATYKRNKQKIEKTLLEKSKSREKE